MQREHLSRSERINESLKALVDGNVRRITHVLYPKELRWVLRNYPVEIEKQDVIRTSTGLMDSCTFILHETKAWPS